MEVIKPLLENCLSVEKPTADYKLEVYDEIYSKSEVFPIKFPVQTIRCKNLIEYISKSTLEENIKSTYPLIHEKTLILMCKFLIHKREYGSEIEKELYSTMSVLELIDRFLLKRSVMFCGPRDQYLLLSGEQGMSGWEEIGTVNEKEPLVLKNCLSYDEMKLSAMLYVSGDTVFINDGSRKNSGIVGNSETIERNGTIIGLIGTRLSKRYLMEWQEIIIEDKQNTPENGYGSMQNSGFFSKLKSSLKDDKNKQLWRNLWAEFYGEESLSYGEAFELYKKESESSDTTKRFIFDNNRMFDNAVYSQHISIAFDCALLEASKRGLDHDKMAYLHVVGIGLGVWKLFGHQDDKFVQVFLERISAISSQLSGISDVHFSYLSNISEGTLKDTGAFIKCDSHPKGGIKVHLSKREPSCKLIGENEGKLLVETYAWDGNAQPGNEFWFGSLYTSGDPAAACSSQVAELHNSHINRRFVCAQNTHIAGMHGLLHIAQYAKRLLEQ